MVARHLLFNIIGLLWRCCDVTNPVWSSCDVSLTTVAWRVKNSKSIRLTSTRIYFELWTWLLEALLCHSGSKIYTGTLSNLSKFQLHLLSVSILCDDVDKNISWLFDALISVLIRSFFDFFKFIWFSLVLLSTVDVGAFRASMKFCLFLWFLPLSSLCRTLLFLCTRLRVVVGTCLIICRVLLLFPLLWLFSIFGSPLLAMK